MLAPGDGSTPYSAALGMSGSTPHAAELALHIVSWLWLTASWLCCYIYVAAVSRDMARPLPIEGSPCCWVASLPDLEAMVHALEATDMLAVDVEHHHLHSYLGFVCLLQLSTGKAT